jgi:signal transduction histidine kinase/CheY-like chemotaxis protein
MGEERVDGPEVALVTDRSTEDTLAVGDFDAFEASVHAIPVVGGSVYAVPPDACAVVTPYELEGTDGVAVTRAIRAVDETVPVVVYARDGSERVASDVVRAGASDYVPISRDSQRERVPDEVVERALAAARDDETGERTDDGDASERNRSSDTAGSSDSGTDAVVVDGARAVPSTVDRERALQAAYEVVAADRPFESKIDDLLGIVREAVGTSYATLSYVDGNDYTFEYVDAPGQDDVAAGDTVPLETTNCEEVVATRETLVLEDVKREAPGLADRPRDGDWGIACYLGAPVTVSGDVYGTFCFYDKQSQEEAFTQWQVTFVELFSDWVGYELQRERYVDGLAALNDLHSVVRTVTDGVVHRSDRREMERTAVDGLANAGSYALAWIDAPDEDGDGTLRTVAFADANATEPVRAADVGLTPAMDADAAADADPTWRAFHDLEVATRDVTAGDGRVGVLADRGLERWAAVPVAFDDESIGVLHVATARREGFAGRELAVLKEVGEILGLAIASVERGAVLERERERLEFVNRFIRHNLLNSLNVVDARTEILAEHVDDAGRSHLETIRGRTADMVELIETLRALMQAFVVDERRETEPKDLAAVVRGEVAAARDAFGAASFALSTPDDSITVLADELLGEIFENLLANAVQHNDDAAPSVRVVVEADGGMARVRVSDDGPGIPEDVLPTVFEKGERGFDSPGTGFGLYLVREIVDAYDGSVSVTNDDDGATFAVTLPCEN